MSQSRRRFLATTALAGGAFYLSSPIKASTVIPGNTRTLGCQQYTWYSFLLRENKEWMKDTATSVSTMKAIGLQSYEPSFGTPEEVMPLYEQLVASGIGCESMYVNSVLHETQLVEENIEGIMRIATDARRVGIRILVTNPTPLDWNGTDNKTDDQLKTQGIALNLLGEKLKDLGVTLAYHNHDAEMRESAREFHHMLTGTDPEVVKFCLDAHWVYRGSGNSQVALFDIAEMYANRIVELHIRQSHNGIWSEVFEDGDIDYARLVGVLAKRRIKPHLVLEQAAEKGTPQSMSATAAISKSLENARKVFGELL